jgi:hypothetical protein
MTRDQLLKRLDNAWMDFKASYAGLSEPEMTGPRVKVKWSVKDVVAHVTTWEQEALKYLPLIIQGGRPPRYSTQYGGIDAFNALMADQKDDLSLAEVLRQAAATHRQLIAYIQSVPESYLLRETRFRRRLRLDTYSHYPLHTKAIREWRARTISAVPNSHAR